MFLFKYTLSAFFTLIVFFNTNGQTKQVTTQQLAWFRYFNKLTFSDKWQLNTQVDERRYIFPGKQHQFVTRTQIIYKINSTISVSQGFTYFLQSPQDPHIESKFIIPELRPHQEVIWEKIKIKSQI